MANSGGGSRAGSYILMIHAIKSLKTKLYAKATPQTKNLILEILEKKRVELDNPSKWYLYQELKEINKAINELKQTS